MGLLVVITILFYALLCNAHEHIIVFIMPTVLSVTSRACCPTLAVVSSTPTLLEQWRL